MMANRFIYASAMLWALLFLAPRPAHAESWLSDRVDIFGKVAAETRIYPEAGVHPGQRSHASGLSLETTAYIEGDGGSSFTITPFLRFDAGDPERTHADLREAYFLTYGDAGDGEWELRLGIDRVFWGVAEARSLVDIINQTDLVEHPNAKTKLGQPMVHLTLSGGWGVLELFGLTGHRKRTYPGEQGRFRALPVVDNRRVTYESPDEEWHIDLAGRYSNSFGPLDIGLSVFEGTSREPTFTPDPAFASLAPHYEQIRQIGLDGQITTGPLLLKLEAIRRTGGRNRMLQEEDYTASILGGEYSVNGPWDTDADLSLFAEWLRDGRERNATDALANSVFLGARVDLNDEHGTNFFLGILESLEADSRVLSAEFSRRLSDSLSLNVEATSHIGFETDEIAYDVRRDSHIGISLEYSF
jgi:hypothetical protein